MLFSNKSHILLSRLTLCHPYFGDELDGLQCISDGHWHGIHLNFITMAKKWHVTWWNNCMTCQKHSQCISTGIEFARSICGRLAASLERLEKGRQYRSCSGPKNENTSRHAMPWYYGTLLCNTISDKNIYADRIWHFCYYLSDKGACFFFSSNCKIIAFSRRVM